MNSSDKIVMKNSGGKLKDLIFNQKGVFNRRSREDDSGGKHNNAMPATEVMAALRAANGQKSYAPQNSQDLVAGLTNHAIAMQNALDAGFAPSPFGSSFPDPANYPDAPDPKQYDKNPNRQLQSRRAGGFSEVVLDANYANAYVVQGEINGHTVTFLLDTGATQVSIPQRIANEAGLSPVGRGHEVRTANGLVKMYDTMLDMLTIGDIQLSYVSGMINPGDRSKTVLLGMSALKNLEFTHREGQLILRQYS